MSAISASTACRGRFGFVQVVLTRPATSERDVVAVFERMASELVGNDIEPLSEQIVCAPDRSPLVRLCRRDAYARAGLDPFLPATVINTTTAEAGLVAGAVTFGILREGPGEATLVRDERGCTIRRCTTAAGTWAFASTSAGNGFDGSVAALRLHLARTWAALDRLGYDPASIRHIRIHARVGNLPRDLREGDVPRIDGSAVAPAIRFLRPPGPSDCHVELIVGEGADGPRFVSTVADPGLDDPAAAISSTYRQAAARAAALGQQLDDAGSATVYLADEAIESRWNDLQRAGRLPGLPALRVRAATGPPLSSFGLDFAFPG